MNRSPIIARETFKTRVPVTYNLAVAKVAMYIQHQESPKYGDLFIFLEPFHEELAFFKTLSKTVAESGGSYVLQEAEVFAMVQ